MCMDALQTPISRAGHAHRRFCSHPDRGQSHLTARQTGPFGTKKFRRIDTLLHRVWIAGLLGTKPRLSTERAFLQPTPPGCIFVSLRIPLVALLEGSRAREFLVTAQRWVSLSLGRWRPDTSSRSNFGEFEQP